MLIGYNGNGTLGYLLQRPRFKPGKSCAVYPPTFIGRPGMNPPLPGGPAPPRAGDWIPILDAPDTAGATGGMTEFVVAAVVYE